jgi:flagellar motor protein MotB
MFASRVHKIEEEEKKDVFAPVADLMVGVVFIFIIMVLALSLVMMEDAVPRPLYDQTAQELAQVKTERDALKKRAAQFSDFVAFVKTEGVVPLLDRLAEADATRTKILQMLKERLAAQGVNVEADFRSGVLRLPTGNLFESAQADPTPHGRDVIRLLGVALADVVPCFLPGAPASIQPNAACPPQLQGSLLNAVYIEGHTDAAALRGGAERFRDNWDLSAARAIEAYRIARDSDPRVPNLKNAEGKSLLGVSGYADTRPVTDGLSEKQRNDKTVMETDRRIEVRLIMAVNRDQVEKALRDLNQRLDRLDAGGK